MRRDGFTPEMYQFRNKQDHLIVLYGEDESKTWSSAAALMVQKHFDNIYYLTGGLAYFCEKFPHYVVPIVPTQYQPKKRSGKRAAPLSPGGLSGGMASLRLMDARGPKNSRSGRVSPRQRMMQQQHGGR
jgi:hypothetical protein